MARCLNDQSQSGIQRERGRHQKRQKQEREVVEDLQQGIGYEEWYGVNDVSFPKDAPLMVVTEREDT